MMTLQDIVNQLAAEPFQPFRIHTASGRDFDIRHPEFAQVGRSTITVYAPPEENPSGAERWHKISLMLVESIEPLTTATKTGTN